MFYSFSVKGHKINSDINIGGPAAIHTSHISTCRRSSSPAGHCSCRALLALLQQPSQQTASLQSGARHCLLHGEPFAAPEHWRAELEDGGQEDRGRERLAALGGGGSLLCYTIVEDIRGGRWHMDSVTTFDCWSLLYKQQSAGSLPRSSPLLLLGCWR